MSKDTTFHFNKNKNKKKATGNPLFDSIYNKSRTLQAMGHNAGELKKSVKHETKAYKESLDRQSEERKKKRKAANESSLIIDAVKS